MVCAIGGMGGPAYTGSTPPAEDDARMDKKHLERLQGTPIFGALREDALEFLLARTRIVSIRAGGWFFREGDPARGMYVLEAGRAEILKGWQGHEMTVRTLAPGDCFGEMALMDLFPRSASIRAIDDCTAIELTPDDLLRLYEHDLEQFALVQMNIGRELSRRLRATDEQLFKARMGDRPDSGHAPFGAL